MDTSNIREDGWEEQLIDYSLGVMESGEAAEFEANLAECRQHVLLAHHYEQVVGWLGASAPSAEPPQGHKSRLMARIGATPQETAPATTIQPALQPASAPTPISSPATTATPPVSLDDYRERRRNILIASVGAVAAALILVVGLWAFFGRGPAGIPEGYKVVQLAPQGTTQANIFVLYNPDRNDAVLLADGLPNIPTGKVFEFWIVPTAGNPIPSGTFAAANAGQTRYQTPTPQNVSTYAGFAVSIEDAPGVDTPTDVIAVGQFANP